jgi:putative oxidoreductase
VQNPLRVAARILTGVTYVVLGFEAARQPGHRVATAAPIIATARKVLPLPDDDELIVRANAGAQVAAGALLMAGKLQRPAALVLAGSIVPTTFAGHPFWTIEDPTQRKAQRIHFLKNLSMLGGLLFAVLD